MLLLSTIPSSRRRFFSESLLKICFSFSHQLFSSRGSWKPPVAGSGFATAPVLPISVLRWWGISEPGIGPGRPAPLMTLPEPVESPAGVTARVSDAGPEPTVSESMAERTVLLPTSLVSSVVVLEARLRPRKAAPIWRDSNLLPVDRRLRARHLHCGQNKRRR